MYLNEQIDKIIGRLKLFEVDKIVDLLVELKGYNIATNDITSEQKTKKTSKQEQTSFNFTNEFLKRRFENRPNDLNEYLKKHPEMLEKLTSTFEVKIDNLNYNQVKESDDDMGKGSVSLRTDGRWQGRFYFQKKRYYVYAKTKTACWEAVRAKRKELTEQFAPVESVSKTMLLNTWFDYWVNTFKAQTVKESTYLKYFEIYDRYVRESIGKQKVSTINSMKLQAFINEIPSYEAKKKLMYILNELFDLLHKENYVIKNAMTMVVLPKKQKDDQPIEADKAVKILSYSNEKIILDKLEKAKATCYHAVKFILYSGLRRGEAIGLTWKNVDIKNEMITVKQQWSKETKRITSPKSSAGYRKIPLLEPAKEVLLELISLPHRDEDFVFPGIERLTQMLVYFSDKINIDFNAHMLRHTFASRCYAAGVDPLKIRDLLGHETLDTTLNTYTHVVNPEDQEIVEYMRNFFINIKVIVPNI